MTLDTIRGRDEAQHWKGAALFADPAHLPDPEQGYHLYELIGTAVSDSTGNALGEISGFLDNSAHFLLKIQHHGQEKLFPYVEEFVQGYDRDTNTLTIQVPEGLWDDQEPES